uniref:Uncharacterized protein n=1 Tax=Panagrolaimus sp. PS1159 TaxID=55785 RepID=A0AC35FZ67_9BILA
MIMALLPKIQELLIEKVKCNSKTAKILSKQKYREKFEYFHVSDIRGEPFDPYLFQQFFVKNMAKHLRLFLTFDYFNEEFEENIKQVFNDSNCFSEEMKKNFDVRFKNIR